MIVFIIEQTRFITMLLYNLYKISNKNIAKYWYICYFIKNTLNNIINNLKLSLTKFLSYCIIVEIDFKLFGGSIALKIRFLTLFFWKIIANKILHIYFYTHDKNLLLIIYYKICQYKIAIIFIAIYIY